ncbi:MAG: hypothetical protein ACI3W8_03600 [Oscillospiraceae bacterium]
MKKLLAMLCAVALTLSLAACGKDTGEESTQNPVDAMSLSDILDSILKDVPDLPGYEPTELTEENFEFYAFVPYAEGYEGLSADALIGSIAHSVVLVRVPADDDAAQAAREMKDNANPRKWICVEAEAVHVRQYGSTILLVMSSAATADAILMNFDALNGVVTPESDLAAAETSAGISDEDPGEDPGETSDEASEETSGDTAVEKPAEKPEEKPAEDPADSAQGSTDLTAVISSVLAGIENLPMYEATELTAETFEFFAFIPYADGYRGVSADAMIGSIAHSVVLVEVPKGTDASAVAATMKSNANPSKWICVTAESVQTAANGQLVLLVMSSQATADAAIANFKAL